MVNLNLNRYSKVKKKSVFIYLYAFNVNFPLYLKKAGLTSRNIILSKKHLTLYRLLL